MKVKCIKKYFDKELNKFIESDTELTVSEARAKVLVDAGLCKVLTTPTPEKVAKPAKKKEA